MDEKTAKLLVRVYASLVLLLILPLLVILYTIFTMDYGGWAMLAIPFALLVLFFIVAVLVMGVGLLRQNRRVLRFSIVICSASLLLGLWLFYVENFLYARYSVNDPFSIVVTGAILYGAIGVYLFGFNKDVKALFEKPVTTAQVKSPEVKS